MIVITNHAVDRYKERACIDSTNKAFSRLLNQLNKQKNIIENGLSILSDIRIPIDDKYLAVVIKSKKNYIVKTIRERKYK